MSLLAALLLLTVPTCQDVLPDIWRVTPYVATPDQEVFIYGAFYQVGGLYVEYYNSTETHSLPAHYYNDMNISFTAPNYSLNNGELIVHTCGGISSKPAYFSVTTDW